MWGSTLDLPSYITALVSPRQSPHLTPLIPSYPRSSNTPDGREEASGDKTKATDLDRLSNNPLPSSGNYCLSDIVSSVNGFSDPPFLHDGELNRVDGASWEALLDNSTVLFPSGCQSLMPSPSSSSGRAVQAMQQGSLSPLMGQIESTSPYVSTTHNARDDDSSLSSLDQDLDFSMYLNWPRSPGTLLTTSPTASHSRQPVERMSISPFRLANYDNTHGPNVEVNFDPTTTLAVDDAIPPVTGDDVEVESLISLLILLKSLLLQIFAAGSRFSGLVGGSTLSNPFSPQSREWILSEVEVLLGFYLKTCLTSIQSRQAARNESAFLPGSTFRFDERRRAFGSWDGSQRLAKLAEATATPAMRSVFRCYCSFPKGKVGIECREAAGNPISEGNPNPTHLVNIWLMPCAVERTLGLCVQLSNRTGDPPITPQVISTFNVDSEDSEIVQRVRSSDLRKLRKLRKLFDLDLGAASAQDLELEWHITT